MNLYKKSFIIFTLLYVLFFVKTWGSVTGFIYSHDDVVYYAQTVSLANDFDVDIKNNLGPFTNIYLSINPQTNKMMSYQPIGPSLIYAIPYCLTRPIVYFISLLRGVIFNEYDPLFFVFICFFILVLFYYSGLFLQKTLRIFFPSEVSDISVIFVLWGTIMPVFVFRRPVYSVVPEFLFSVLLLNLIVEMHKNLKVTVSRTVWLGIISGFLIITRWNDVYILVFCIAMLAYILKKSGKFKNILMYCSIYLSIFFLFYFIQAVVWIRIYGSVREFLFYYSKMHINYINSGVPLRELSWYKKYVWNFIYILFGKDWGALYTMPILLFGGIMFIFNSKFRVSSSKIVQICIFSIMFYIPFYVTLQWRNTGGYYGYRFLISLLPLSAIGFSEYIEKKWQKHKKSIICFILLFCVFNFLVILPFELTENTTLHSGNITPMGGDDWGNNSYVLNAVKFYFSSSTKTLITCFLRGYLGAFIFGILSLFNVDLNRFSPKVKEYFDLVSYKQYTAFFYLMLVIIFSFLLIKKNTKRI